MCASLCCTVSGKVLQDMMSGSSAGSAPLSVDFCRSDAQQYPFLLSLLSWRCPAVPIPSIPSVVAMPSSTHSFYPFCRGDAQQYPFLLSLLSWRCPPVGPPTHSFYPFCRGDAQQHTFLLSLLSWRCHQHPFLLSRHITA